MERIECGHKQTNYEAYYTNDGVMLVCTFCGKSKELRAYGYRVLERSG